VKKTESDLVKAIARIPDGAMVGLGGFILQNKAMDAVREVVRQGKRNLTVVCAAPASLDAELLIAGGCVKEIIVQSLSLERFAPVGPAFRAAAQEGTLRVVDLDQGCVVAGLRAAAYGIDSLVARSAGGADFARVAPDWFRTVSDPFTQRTGMAVRAMQPDFALVHATKADDSGHAQNDGSDFNDELLCCAAKQIIFTVERIVPRAEVAAAATRTLGFAHNTAAVCLRPGGARPCAAHAVYDYDERALMEYARIAGDPTALQAYVRDLTEEHA
jgi:glutaconate CoA-transferase subunit A